MPKKIGICINYGGCDKARAKEKQEVEATNFVCEKCGKPLRETGPDTKNPNWKLIGGIAAVVVLGGGAGAYFAMAGDGGELKGLSLNKVSAACIVGGMDTLTVSIDPADASATYIWSSSDETVAAVKDGIVTMTGEGSATITVKPEGNDEITAVCTYEVSKPATKGKSGGETYNPNDGGDISAYFDWASYDGPVRGGKAHGIGGTLIVKKNHSIDLKDAKGGMLNMSPGDKIVNTKFTNGVLNQGELQRKNGERTYFVIGG